ncbi:MAG: hypothetical protein C4541_01920 [Candidatus Auribacter fodinae]|uniref:Uncharacterized protein n=1 Tax=Candidatus Auribacter fodinae TaxID=2093366 RepID=A0A3A4RFX4_9BACT|nr:MAG: hypothetical protein C4541_01920 [Candidatus Auribacter fodinae]
MFFFQCSQYIKTVYIFLSRPDITIPGFPLFYFLNSIQKKLKNGFAFMPDCGKLMIQQKKRESCR